jgi:lipopolysaccharide export system permease protein
MKRLDRYIGNEVISATLLVLFVFVGLEFFIEVSSQVGSVSRHGFTFWKMLLYVCMRMPAILYILFPIIAFIGCLVGLGRLAVGSELTIMRSVGMSISRITRSVVISSLVLIVAMTFIGEIVAPRLQMASELLKAVTKSPQISYDVWLKHGNVFIHVDAISWPDHLKNVSEFEFNGQKLVRYAFSKKGIKSAGKWRLVDGIEKNIQSDGVHSVYFHNRPIDFQFAQDSVKSYAAGSLNGSVRDIWKIIHYKKLSGLSSDLYGYIFWQRMIQPLTTILMICLGVPFVFGSLRSASASMRLVVGISVGVVFYMLNRFFGPVTLIYQFPPILSAAAPTFLFALFYIYLFRRLA